MHKSETIGALAAALAKAQGSFPLVTKGRTAKVDSARTGRSFSYSYADHSDAVSALAPILSANGLAVSQHLAMPDAGHIEVTTLLGHSSGEWIESTMSWVVADKDNRAIGSAVTYARRYSYLAAVGAAAADEDDDGEAARGGSHEMGARKTPPDARQAAQANAPKARTEEQYSSIIAGLTTLGIKEAAQPDLVKKLAGKLSPASYDGAEEVIAGLSRMLDERRRKETGAGKPQEDHG